MRSLLFTGKENKKGQFQVATNAIWGVVGFALAVIIALIFIGVLVGGGFFTASSAEQLALNNISTNVTAGVVTVTSKLPTLFTVIGIAIILTVITLLVVLARRMGMGGGNFAQ